ncbi:unnamed protein product [Fusarium equiseti]|uniref:Uncharacterized protein n=1 Tax=Fusarium equiseti TaxID=61235 RepID=A0A8J2IZP2_FUSEQ|nr:unnamed protein product [Fusarium equiseti]
MSHQDSHYDSDGSITHTSHSSDEDPLDEYVEGRICHFLGHLEAIPINREGTLAHVHHAWIRALGAPDREFSVLNSNAHGPRFDFCFKLPSPGNNWLARTSDGTGGTTELFETVQKHSTKGYKIHVYECVHLQSSSWIIESYLKEEKMKRVSEGENMIWDLQQRLGFEIGDGYARHFRDRPFKYHGFGRDIRDRDGDEYDDEDERLDRGEYLSDLSEYADEGSDEEAEDEEVEDEDEESVPTIGAIWGSLA